MATKTIESVLQENRVFPPAEAFVRQANMPGMDAYRKLCAEAEQDFTGFWGRLAREHVLWHKPFTRVLDESKRAVLQVVRRRRAERLVQLPRPPPADPARQDRDHLRGRRRQGHEDHLPGAPPPRLHVRERAEVARHQARATASSSTCRCRSRPWSRCRRARASAPSTRSCSAASPPRACRSASSTPARSRCSPPTGSSAADARFRSRPPWTRRSRWAAASRSRRWWSTSAPAARWQWDAKRDVWLHDLVKGQSETCEPDMGRRRAPALHPLHLGLHRQAQGHTAFHRRLPAVDHPHHEVGVRLQADRRLLVHGRRGLGDRALLHLLRPARVRRHRDHVRGRAGLPRCRALLEDDPGPQGDACSTRRRPRSARSSRPAATCRRSTTSVAAHPRHGRRADQPRSVDVVPRDRGRRPLPDRRHLVADGNRRPHDHARCRARRRPSPVRRRSRCPASSSDIVDETGRSVGKGKGGILVIKRPWPSMLRTIWGDAERYQARPTTRRISRASTTSPATARPTTRTAISASWAASTTC